MICSNCCTILILIFLILGNIEMSVYYMSWGDANEMRLWMYYLERSIEWAVQRLTDAWDFILYI